MSIGLIVALFVLWLFAMGKFGDYARLIHSQNGGASGSF